MRQIFTSLILFFSLMLNAQMNPNCDVLLAQECEECDCLIKKGDCYAQDRNYAEAIKKYNATVACDEGFKDMTESKLIAVFELINGEMENANSLRLEAIKGQKAAEQAEIEAKKQEDIAQEQARIAKGKTKNVQDVINELYFYGDSLALAYKRNQFGEGLYGFINKKGKLLIDFKFQEALPFSHKGYAKVKRENIDYLIDTKGREYRWTNDINKLNEDIEVFDYSLQRRFKIDNIYQKILNGEQLTILYLNHCNIAQLPAEIGRLTNLQTLDLSHNYILSSLPAEIGRLTNLQTLDLSRNYILSSLPTAIGRLTNLQTLDLSHNYSLLSLPTEIVRLTNLQTLELGSNSLSSLPAEIGRLTNLRILNLSYNRNLSYLPAEIGQLTNLQTLELGSTNLSSLPIEIGQLTNLQTLDLGNNSLLSLPIEIGQLTDLQNLDLSYNRNLSYLPDEIVRLTNLQTLDLSYTNLSQKEKQKIKKLLPNCDIKF